METRATILALATEVPETALSQECFSVTASKRLSLSGPRTRLLKRITSGSQIQKRHTVLADFAEEDPQGSFFSADEAGLLPKTGKRNDLYKNAAPKLAESVCRSALGQWGGDPKAITHVISVSCTGMIAPGIEYLLIDRLGLSRDVERLGINFMGCFGAFKGLAIAKALALECSEHRVLVVCTELCSLHFQGDLNIDTIVANSIFADGAAAVVVGTNPRAGERPLFAIESQKSAALENTLDLMTWEAGDYGYHMRLSASVSSHLETHISAFVERVIGLDLRFDQCTWAVHPGGKDILEAITKACHLSEEQISASWAVLREYGNMSSPTFLFVLEQVLKSACSKEWVIGLGFGPGLSIEGLLLKNVAESAVS